MDSKYCDARQASLEVRLGVVSNSAADAGQEVGDLLGGRASRSPPSEGSSCWPL